MFFIKTLAHNKNIPYSLHTVHLHLIQTNGDAMKTIITAEQSRMARRALDLTQNQVIQKGGVSGYKLKQFESGFADPEGVTPFLRELRDFYEAEGYQFTDTLETTASAPVAGETVRVVRDALIVCDRLTHSQRGAIQDRVRLLLGSLNRDIEQKAVGGVFELYDSDTDMARDNAIATCTATSWTFRERAKC